MTKKQRTLRLSPEAEAIMLRLAQKLGISQTAVVEMALRRLAELEGKSK